MDGPQSHCFTFGFQFQRVARFEMELVAHSLGDDDPASFGDC
jgi:hypothetical protein